jgi:hypothetical protein
MNDLTKYLVEGILQEAEIGIVVLLPGGFKPPHGGHLELALTYSKLPNVSEVKILVGPKEREGITREQSIAVWNELLIGARNITVQKVAEDNPLLAAYKYIETAIPGTYALAASSKGEDYERVKKFVQGHAKKGPYYKKNVNVVELSANTKPLTYNKRVDGLNGKGVSASVLRKDLAKKDYKNFKTNYPSTTPENVLRAIYDLLTKKTTLSEDKIDDFVNKIKVKFKDFVTKISQETEETKEAFKLIVQAAKGEKDLSDIEKKQVGDQMKDVLKTIGLTTASILPGGTIYFIIIKLLKLEKYTLPSSFLSERIVLAEGGAAGHLAHPYEDYDLTFQDIQNMIDAALGGTLVSAQEKLDGQNLMVTYKDGQVRAARNKGQVKDFAANSLTVKQVEDMFAGRGPIQAAFAEAMKDLETAINKLSVNQKQKFFANGAKFVNLEVLYPETANVVPYGASQLRLHHIKEYDKAGNVVGEDVEAVRQLQGAIRQVQAEKQKTYEIRITDPITIKKSADYKAQKEELTKTITSLMSIYNLKLTDKVGLYYQAWWKNYINQIAKTYQYTVPENTITQLINRWSFGNKEVNIRVIRDGIDNDEFKNWVVDFDKKEYAEQKKIANKPIENLFLKLGVYTLGNIENLVSLNPNDSVRQMKGDLKKAIEQIKSFAKTDTTDEGITALKFLKRELARLQDIGGFNAILPTEGIVFKYNEKLFKLTGAFAPINQLLGYMRF